MNWDSPEDRAKLIEDVGPVQYEIRLRQHRLASIINTVNGHAIRPTVTRFGRLYMVGDTGRAFRWLSEAETFARANPPE